MSNQVVFKQHTALRHPKKQHAGQATFKYHQSLVLMVVLDS
jgi:hypothetical protein